MQNRPLLKKMNQVIMKMKIKMYCGKPKRYAFLTERYAFCTERYAFLTERVSKHSINKRTKYNKRNKRRIPLGILTEFFQALPAQQNATASLDEPTQASAHCVCNIDKTHSLKTEIFNNGNGWLRALAENWAWLLANWETECPSHYVMRHTFAGKDYFS